MHRVALTLALLLLPTLALADGQDPEDHENYFKDVDPVKVDGLTITFSHQHAKMEFILAKAKVENEADRWLFIDPRASEWVLGGKGEVASASKPKEVVIEPYGSQTITYRVEGDVDDGADYHVNHAQLRLQGFAAAKNEGATVRADDFQIPAAKNKFKAGPFDCKLNRLKNDTSYTRAAFTCTYKGDQIGYIDPSSAGWTIPSGQHFANQGKEADKEVLQPGDKVKFAVAADIDSSIFDMEEDGVWYLNWNDTFSEAKKSPMKLPTVSFELDVDKTEREND